MWNVSSLEEFRYYNCPECDSKYSSKEQFVGHAMVAHDNAHNILPTILKGEKVKATKKNELIENVDLEGFDDNRNDNCMGIQIAKVESITDDLTRKSGSSDAEVATEGIDATNELITSNNDEHDTSRTETISHTSCTESLSDAEPETFETSTLDSPVTLKITNEQKKPIGENLLVRPKKHKLCKEV